MATGVSSGRPWRTSPSAKICSACRRRHYAATPAAYALPVQATHYYWALCTDRRLLVAPYASTLPYDLERIRVHLHPYLVPHNSLRQYQSSHRTASVPDTQSQQSRGRREKKREEEGEGAKEGGRG
eukprot:1911184-Rhodomonas_salina.1